MYVIAFFGLLMIFLSAVMMIDPDSWSNGLLKFSRMTYFHEFEILSRLFFGVIFAAFAEQTRYPTVIGAFGYLMVAVGVGLVFAGPTRHRQFATWSAVRFSSVFRPAGIASAIFGAFLVYAALCGH